MFERNLCIMARKYKPRNVRQYSDRGHSSNAAYGQYGDYYDDEYYDEPYPDEHDSQGIPGWALITVGILVGMFVLAFGWMFITSYFDSGAENPTPASTTSSPSASSSTVPDPSTVAVNKLPGELTPTVANEPEPERAPAPTTVFLEEPDEPEVVERYTEIVTITPGPGEIVDPVITVTEVVDP